MCHLLHYIVPCTRQEEWYSSWCPRLISSGPTSPRWSPSCDSCRPCTWVHLTEKHPCLTTSWHLCRSWPRQKHQQKSCCWTSHAGTRRRAIVPGARQRSSYWIQSCHCHCPAQLTTPQPRPVLTGALDTTEPVLQWTDTHQWPPTHFSETKSPSKQPSFQRSDQRWFPAISSRSPLAGWWPGLREVWPSQVTRPWPLSHC